MAAIELTDLTKHYKQGKNIVKALDGVSLSIQSGEFVAVVGRSGSGKTTMLDLLGLLLRPTRAMRLLEEVDLTDRVEHRPTELSGGQAQRVAIARSLINNPTLVLGDEPTGEVDSETSTQLIDLMRRMNRERGVTFVIVTHDMDIANRTDRIIRLKDGRVLSDERITATIGSVAGSAIPA
jgi:ABC-type lipoprotein export system ATPase subunit